MELENSDTLVYVGGEIKALGERKIGGYLCLFSTQKDPDLQGDYFDTKTDFDFEDGDKRSLYFNHGMDAKVGNRKIGTATLKKDDIGVWMDGILRESDEYADAILEMVKDGKMGYSSGAVAHLVRRTPLGKSAAYLNAWPIGEGSITHTPAEPRTRAIPLKTWAATFRDKPGEHKAIEKKEIDDPASTEKRGLSFADERELEGKLRDAGFSRKQAVALALHGWKGLQRDADEAETPTPPVPATPAPDSATESLRRSHQMHAADALLFSARLAELVCAE